MSTNGKSPESNGFASWFTLVRGDGPVVTAAIHAGHGVRPEVAERLALDRGQRRREEDPYTDRLTAVAATRLVAHRSRFEVDLNRPREQAVYRRPEEAWGLEVWEGELPPAMCSASLALHDAFYRSAEVLLRDLEERQGRFVVLDLHSYNHRREGPQAPPADLEANPEVNVGTGSLPRRWSPLVERFIADLAAGGGRRRLDVRENVKFQGGYFPRWVHETFPESGCCLAIELKKTFMDEWTGELDERALERLRQALAATLPGLEEELARR